MAIFRAHLIATCAVVLVVTGCAEAFPTGWGDDGSEGGGAVDASDHPHSDAADVTTPDASPDAPPAPPPIGYACTQAPSYPKNDRCSSAYDLSAGASMPGGVTVYGDTTGYPDSLEPPSYYTSGFSLNGPDAIYRVQLAAGQVLTAELTTDAASFDASLYILDNCQSASNYLAGSSKFDGPGVEKVAYTPPSKGTYYVIVDSYHATEYGCYTLHVTVE